MLQLLLFGCIVFPLIAALAVLINKRTSLHRYLVMAGVGITAIFAISLAAYGGFSLSFASNGVWARAITGLDFALLLYILYLACKLKHKLTQGLALAQLAGLAYLDFWLIKSPQTPMMYADPLSLVMVLIISLVGGVICIYALGYMHEHEDHLRLAKTKQNRFFFFLILFLGAMNGLVLCDNLAWLFFFWEVTTLCSFMLISHDDTAIAKTNATNALWMNMVGGLAFVSAMLFMQKSLGSLSIQEVLSLSSNSLLYTNAWLLPLAFLCLAGFTKSAQIPFQSWLCGAMVAPTPVSALLHSSTMVKAGVYLILRISPAFTGTMLAGLVSLLGAFTFMAASALACGQSNGKKILAYSTIANLGLIVACAGIGSNAAITAAIFLIIFHAVSKALLFLCVGAIEQQIGSRDIEDMRGLYKVMPRTAIITLVGIITMMLPPFGALLAKWMALEAAAVAPVFMPILVTLIAFGSALTVLFWARWAGMILGNDPLAKHKPVPETMDITVMGSLQTLLGSTLILSLLSPVIYLAINNSITSLYGDTNQYAATLGIFQNNVGLFAIYPLFILVGLGVWYSLRASNKCTATVLPYMSGIQRVENDLVGFSGPLSSCTIPTASNYYLENWFGEKTLTTKLNTIALVLMVIMLGGLL